MAGKRKVQRASRSGGDLGPQGCEDCAEGIAPVDDIFER
jgi:hypothetical protein